MAKAVRSTKSAGKPATSAAPASAPGKNGHGSTQRSPKPRLAVAPRVEGPSPQNFACRWAPGSDGAGDLTIAYAGPLASRDDVRVRFGVMREGGTRWTEVREIDLERESSGVAVATLEVTAGPRIEAVQLAVCAGQDWDNGGRTPLGFYEWRAGSQQLTVT